MRTLDWPGLLAVLITVIAIVAAGELFDRRGRKSSADVALEAVLGPVPEDVDHALCRADDCGRELCYCHQRCIGRDEPACPHHEFLCEDHRLECTDCLIDYVMDGEAA